MLLHERSRALAGLLADARTPPARPVAPVGAVAKKARLPEAQEVKELQSNSDFTFLTKSGSRLKRWKMNAFMPCLVPKKFLTVPVTSNF